MCRRLGIYALCLLLLGQTLSGCAEMTEQQKGTAIGAGLGALVGAGVGALAGGEKGAVIGSLGGAVLGGLVGWQVGEYRAKKVKEGQQAGGDTKWTPQQGVVAKIDSSGAAPAQVKPGDQVVLKTEYTLLAPPEQGDVAVKEVRTISFNNQSVGQLARTSKLTAGTYVTEQPMKLPTDAAPGTYTVTTVVEPVVEKAKKDQDMAAFVVRHVAR
jgi:YmgG-like glycine-zipper protein